MIDWNPPIMQNTVLQCLLHMHQFEFALHTVESTAMVRNLGINWGMCSKHCSTSDMPRSERLPKAQGASRHCILLFDWSTHSNV